MAHSPSHHSSSTVVSSTAVAPSVSPSTPTASLASSSSAFVANISRSTSQFGKIMSDISGMRTSKEHKVIFVGTLACIGIMITT